MKILIHGDDTFHSLQIFKEIVGQFKQKHEAQGKNIFSYSSKDDLKPAINLINQTSLFTIKQLLIIDDCHNFKATDLEVVCQLNQRVNNDTTVIYRANKSLTGKSKLEAELLNADKVYHHPTPSRPALEKWIADMAKKTNLNLEPAVINKLLATTTDKWIINNLIKQMSAHAKATNQNNHQNLLDLLTIYNDDEPIFALTESLASGNGKNALKILHQYLTAGAEPLMILGLLSKHLRDLISAKNGLKANFKSEYIYNKLANVGQKFSITQLSLWQQNVILTDIAIKKGQPPLTSINTLVIKMANFNK